MKQLFTVLLAAGMLFVACDKNDDKNETLENETMTNQSFKGTLIVDLTDGSAYTQEDVTVDYAITDTAGFVLTFNQVSFSPRMPMKLDMSIPNVSYVIVGSEITLAGNGIVPLAMGKEFEQYTITNLEGTIADGTMSVSMKCGSSPMKFTGVKAETNRD